MTENDADHPLGSCGEGILAHPLPALDDPEGDRVPAGLPPVVDAHVHVFADRLFAAIYGWFDRHGWPIRHRLGAREVVAFLRARGVAHVVALHYAHRPGIAREMNALVAEIARETPGVTGLATVFPGEPEAVAILEEGFALGLRGVKLHCHVQCVSPDDPALGPVYDLCARRGMPLVLHAGREPKSPGLRCDPHLLCSVDRIARVIREHPRLRLCVPHLGCDEYAPYAALLERHDNLWLDTAMVLADYFPGSDAAEAAWIRLVHARPDRVLYGTDFPILPYAWDRELRRIERAGLPPDALAKVLGGNAAALYGAVAE